MQSELRAKDLGGEALKLEGDLQRKEGEHALTWLDNKGCAVKVKTK